MKGSLHVKIVPQVKLLSKVKLLVMHVPQAFMHQRKALTFAHLAKWAVSQTSQERALAILVHSTSQPIKLLPTKSRIVFAGEAPTILVRVRLASSAVRQWTTPGSAKLARQGLCVQA